MRVRFAAIGFEHGHIYGQVAVMLAAGAELVAYHDVDAERIARFQQRFPFGRRADSIQQILEDETIDLVLSATVPCERADLGIAVMRHGKDYMSDKPAFTDFDQLRRARQAQVETGRIFSINFSEHLTQKATIKAGQLVAAGAIGQVAQTSGFGPHRLFGQSQRPAWTFDRRYFGGIINDLASHQIEQFLYFTGSDAAEVVAATVGNFGFRQYPLMHDFGDLTLRSAKAVGHIRVDWLTPAGLPVWGDVRLFIVGTQGTIELRKNIDIAGRSGESHLFLVDQQGTHYIDCSDTEITYGRDLIADIRERTETAIPQARCFLASELALQAEAMAVDLTRLPA
ncbi:MAG: Gfo/Idh/MocA family oxidoreductase [Chloroflexi bacterium]|nr:Gfo/Idh/MocA family oxidoreductase [Chloroflexota bacterium]MCY3582958.1 Gfo/Idh/MocA family oxidoreductase [Chloroflexota bacterium]MCY3716862.1 Gfo/Idh/MocA family oxidoreductase [Chloroflexota bacterium]MDE2649253.1 Gfo/Idh/MocA family oxidoreductase [Chloroflexota bacterium]MXX82954.1 Gfo/Idh/MocA family oxidoreductase [Chloroflexota bacterium]